MRAIYRLFCGLALLSALSAVPAGAQLQQVAWEDLPERLAGRLIPIEELGVSDCPKDLAQRDPDRRVLQYIENVLYAWEEYDLRASRTFCIVLQQPLSKALSPGEAQVLLSASGLWMEQQGVISTEAEILDPSDPRLQGAADDWVAPAEPSKGATPEGLDRGITGWDSPLEKSGASEGEGEGRRRVKAVSSRGVTGKSVIGGRDGRQRITATQSFPFNVISYLSFNTSRGGSRATGFLVSPYMVLTNGHVIWDEDAGQFVTDLEIAPGQTQASTGGRVERPHGTRRAVRFATNAGWVETHRIEFDYSAAFFDTPFSGISTFMPLVFDAAPGRGGIVNVAGFPKEIGNDGDSQALWHDDDVVEAVQGRVLRHKADTTGGNSGSPVWETFSGTGQRRAIAVHSSADLLGVANSAARLVSQNFELISEWLAWTPQTSRGLRLTINQVDPAACPAIRAVASVTDPTGRPVVDLIRSNFRLFENGVEQRVSVSQAEVGNAPVSVTLVLDASGSLSDTDVQNIRTAARAFVDLLGERDKVAVFHFANGVARVQDFTTDKGLAKAAINRLDRNGGAVGDGSQTALFDAIIEAAGYTSNAVGRRALVAMTDGQNNTGTSSPQRAVDAAQAAGAPVFTIGFGSASVSVLQQIATGTGGLFFFGANSNDLQTILRTIGRTLGNQYILSWLTGFVSGGTERIEVRVSDGVNQDQKSTTYSQAATGCRRPSTCTVRVISPNGGEVWTKGTPQTVRWSTSGPACGGIGVGVYNGGDVWPLVDLTANDGTETFNIDFLPPGSDYQVVVTDRATNVSGAVDFSDGTFRIETPATGRRLTCVQNAETLCLRRGRFQVRVVWGTTSALSGVAKAIPLTRDAGAFYFFDSQNPELVVKVLDGRSVNAHFWAFSGALTSLPYSIFVTDSTTGETRVYTNVDGDFASFGDSAAFGPPLEDDEEDEDDEEVEEVEEVGIDASSSPAATGHPFGIAPESEGFSFSAPKAGQTVLWDQTNNPGPTGTSSENRVDAGADPLDTEAADDFVVPQKKLWDIEGVDAVGFYFGSGARGPADSVNVTIYGDRNGAPGSVQCSYSRLRPNRGLGSGVFEINLPQPCRVLSGRSWVSVQANQDFPRAGQWAWMSRTRQQERPAVWRNPGNGYATGCREFNRLGGCVGLREPDLLFKLRGRTATGGTPCSANASTLCFQSNRFKVELSFVDTRGRTVSARAVSVSPISGYFWFLDANNPELTVKLIDGRAANGNFWVFYGALTNVDYTLRVTDTATGRTKTYENRQGRLVSVGDTTAFPGQ
jgi:VWFA-related protein